MCLSFHYTRTEYHPHRLLHHLEQHHQSSPKSIMLTIKITPHPTGMLPYITQGNVLEILRIAECIFSDTAAIGTSP